MVSDPLIFCVLFEIFQPAYKSEHIGSGIPMTGNIPHGHLIVPENIFCKISLDLYSKNLYKFLEFFLFG